MEFSTEAADLTQKGLASMFSEREWERFYTSLKSQTGLDLRQYKPDQVRRRIIHMVQSRALNELDAFWGQLSRNEKELQWFLDKLAINVTELYRDPEKWAELREKIIPDLLTRSYALKCWSAGCSTGAEAYSLAMLFDTQFPTPHHILGTDIDMAALANANKGIFSEAEMKSVPDDLRHKYFQPFQEGWRADVRLRRYLTFKRHNLLQDTIQEGYDLILCRNVTIYFTEETKDELYSRLFQALKPGGYLFVGSTERMFNAKQLGFESAIPFFYRKPYEEDYRWRIAS